MSAISDQHQFHIPVMGTAFTLDTPIRVARFGISSVMSIGDDDLCENLRAYYSAEYGFSYEPIKKWDKDYRVRRITGYLNLVQDIVDQQMATLRTESFEPSTDLTKYFELLPPSSSLRHQYEAMLDMSEGPDKETAQNALREDVKPGSLDVNIMTKLDRDNFSKKGEVLGLGESDALSALRAYAQSKISSSVIFSAGFNRRLYAYIANFEDFFPDKLGQIKKKIVLKVSDFRSSMTQGRFLAKKGLWVSEHRIESGLNCGGHVFPSEGFLLGPILNEFKQKKDELIADLKRVCNGALDKLGRPKFEGDVDADITVQGGIGTAGEQNFLLSYFGVKRTGWATPFLLVPEVTTLDAPTRDLLKKAEEKDLYTSGVSPLGVPFNTVYGTQSEAQKLGRIRDGKPGSPCPKGHLVSNMEFTRKPICTASVAYQKKKLAQLDEMDLSDAQREDEKAAVLEKVCLCEDLAAGAMIHYERDSKWPKASAVCPGPNLAYFSRYATLAEMVSHIYGRLNLLNQKKRPNMFIKELKMYVDHLGRDIKKSLPKASDRQLESLNRFRANLLDGFQFYKELIPELKHESAAYRNAMTEELVAIRRDLDALVAKYAEIFSVPQATTA